MVEDDLFLKKSARDKLALLGAIQRDSQAAVPVTARLHNAQPAVGEVNLRRIATLMNRNYGTLYYVFTHLNQDLAALARGRRHLYDVAPGVLRAHLVQSSVPYRFLVALLDQEPGDFDHFLAGVGVSRATCLRYLRPLRALAGELGVRVVYEKMALRGSELAQRLFLTCGLWLATKGRWWPLTALNREAALGQVTGVCGAFGLGLGNPVLRELFAYLLTISLTRLGQRQGLEAVPSALSYPVPNLFEGRLAAWAPAQQAAQFAESAALYQLFAMLSGAFATDAAAVAKALATGERYGGRLFAVVERFWTLLPPPVLDQAQLPAARQDALRLDLLATAMGVVVFGRDLSGILARHLAPQQDAATDADTAALVRQTLAAALYDTPLPGLNQQALTAAFAALLSRYRRQVQPRRRVQVALMLEPLTLGYVELVGFLTQVPFVTVVRDQYATADLIVAATAVPLPPASADMPPVFTWPSVATSDVFGELYAALHTLYTAKLAAAQAK
ncbi:helix-turn-helix domain-containing protein [Lacticaseibacillus parakribbianus]|uniref:helix-turn-helix domain-containing protein n=1 Tax=Lacticaseibacillus parakribbianus TaxID=2970927 RepID=UPI0021CB2C55|nr:helix-turn-helix domain-containing protein [Lacticaseibacillus parakribbianus]